MEKNTTTKNCNSQESAQQYPEKGPKQQSIIKRKFNRRKEYQPFKMKEKDFPINSSYYTKQNINFRIK